MSDERFLEGSYNGKVYHAPDFEQTIQRAEQFGVKKFLFASGYLEDAEISLDLSLRSEHFYTTVGVHPCRALEPVKGRLQNSAANDGSSMDSSERMGLISAYFERLDDFISRAPRGKIIAVGECGLDYDRFEFADKVCQKEVFEPHFALAEKYELPMYLHSRATGMEFIDTVRLHRHRFPTGVVHSFTGDSGEMRAICDLDMYIGLNGCSMKNEQNCEVVRQVPLDRLLVETDCPYCDIRNSHASSVHVKTKFPRIAKKKYEPNSGEFQIVRERNEPCTLVQVVEVIATLKGLTTQEVAHASYENSLRMFRLKRDS